jgi:enamine deaminase RidA (YjgF/YER057c/UK114 family)
MVAFLSRGGPGLLTPFNVESAGGACPEGVKRRQRLAASPSEISDDTLDVAGPGLETGRVTRLSAVDSESLPRARRHAHGVKGWGDLLEVSAQTGRNREGRMVSADIAEQYAQALDNVLDVVWAAGGKPEAMTRLTVYVTDARQYRLREKAVAAAWKSRLGGHRPALTVVEVAGLLDDEALVAIEAVALV